MDTGNKSTTVNSVRLSKLVDVSEAVTGGLNDILEPEFDWLFLESDDIPNVTTFAVAKEEAVLACLRGVLEDEAGKCNSNARESELQVDLWELREMALTPGGMQSPQLRKRAWPTLLNCHSHVLLRSTTTQAATIPRGTDLIALKQDVARTIWNVEEHLTASKRQQQAENYQLHSSMRGLVEKQERKKSVRFAPLAVEANFNAGDINISRTNTNMVDDPPGTIATSPTSEDGGEHTSILSTDDEIEKIRRDGADDASINTEETSFTLSSRIVRWRTVTKHEKKVLFNVIASVLRTEPEQTDVYEDDRYHYYSGLHDLTALLMINLESPSLTCLVLQKLAKYQLRDALRDDYWAPHETALNLTFMPLLEMFDSTVFRHLTSAGISFPNFCRAWVKCWYAQDVSDIRVASRLVDIFLVSHPLMPIYLAVAVVVHNRRSILRHQKNLVSLYSLLRGLAANSINEATVETIVSMALRYIKRFPPSALIANATNATCDPLIVSGIAMFQNSPVPLARVHTDWALLQRAKDMRNNPFDSSPVVESSATEAGHLSVTFDPRKYPLSAAAAGLGPAQGYDRKATFFMLLLVIIALAITAPWTTVYHYSLPMKYENQPIVLLSHNKRLDWEGKERVQRKHATSNVLRFPQNHSNLLLLSSTASSMRIFPRQRRFSIQQDLQTHKKYDTPILDIEHSSAKSSMWSLVLSANLWLYMPAHLWHVLHRKWSHIVSWLGRYVEDASFMNK